MCICDCGCVVCSVVVLERGVCLHAFLPNEAMNVYTTIFSIPIATYGYGELHMIHSYEQGGVSPLHTASEEGHTEIVDTLLRRGADPNLATMVLGYGDWCMCLFHLLRGLNWCSVCIVLSLLKVKTPTA